MVVSWWLVAFLCSSHSRILLKTNKAHTVVFHSERGDSVTFTPCPFEKY